MKTATTATQPHYGWRQTFAALQYPNYRLWFFGQIVSLAGTWMQNTAQGFLVYELTGSPAFLGYVGFAAGVPSWLFMLFGGVVADRIPRRNLMIVTQTAMMGLAFILAGLTFTGLVQPWHIVVLAFCLGIANAFDAPARQAFVAELVEREDMTNAIALNSGMFNTASIVGPALAGLAYAAFGPAWCFTLNGVSFIAVIAALAAMKLALPPRAERQPPALTRLKEGLAYTAAEPMVRTIILLVGLTSLFGFSFTTLMPAWAVDILGGDVKTNGWLRAAQGLGALISALTIASLGRFKFRGRLLTLGSFAFPVLLLVFSAVRWTPLALLVMVGIGLALILMFNLANSLVQTTVPDALRGRVMAIYSLTFFGLVPLGALMMGSLAEAFSEPAAVRLGALVLLGCATILSIFAPRLRKME